MYFYLSNGNTSGCKQSICLFSCLHFKGFVKKTRKEGDEIGPSPPCPVLLLPGEPQGEDSVHKGSNILAIIERLNSRKGKLLIADFFFHKTLQTGSDLRLWALNCSFVPTMKTAPSCVMGCQQVPVASYDDHITTLKSHSC